MRVPDWTESGDTDPQFANADATQYGYFANSSTPSHGQFSEVWVRDSVRRRHGTYGIRVTCFPDSYTANSNSSLNVRVYPKPFGAGGLGIADGVEEWFGWSWWFPTGFPQGGNDVWSLMGFYTAENRDLWPTNYTYAFDPVPGALTLGIRTGKLPDPGSPGFDPIPPPNGNGYNVENLPILGTGAPRPFTKDVWHDFYVYVLYKAQTNGIFEMWHRIEGESSFVKLYSNRNDSSALINVAPHPTLYWNDANGIPPAGGRAVYMCYRPALSATVQYWADGFFARQSQAAVLAEFPSIYTERELRVRGLLREQIQSWRLEKRTWAWIKKTPVWTAFKEVGGS